MMVTLPKVRQGARNRVSNKLPVPVVCNLCSGSIIATDHKSVYGRDFSKWPYLYLCECCGAYVGMHPNTDIPLGTLADKPLREWRKKAKLPFEWWRGHYKIDRGLAYKTLAAELNIDVSACHFGWFDVSQCEKAYSAINLLIEKWAKNGNQTKVL
ncbi:MAG: hypothetical protein [Bacteriophage sp.]|nr:MAG: hypothetical protein [Bacteriophage sp.]